jgi:hypothetical protein
MLARFFRADEDNEFIDKDIHLLPKYNDNGMAEDPVPDEIKQFILRHLDSIGQLEALLLLRGNPGEEWGARAVARRLYIREQEAAPILARLTKSGFIAASMSEPTVYKYQPQPIQTVALERALLCWANGEQHSLDYGQTGFHLLQPVALALGDSAYFLNDFAFWSSLGD